MNRLGYLIRVNIRNLLSYKQFAFINIIGLSVGLTISLLILLYVRFETSFDRFNPGSGDIYRVVQRNLQSGEVGAATPLPLPDVLKKDFPEIDRVVGLIRTSDDIRIGKERFNELKGAMVEAGFFDMFHFPLISGNPDLLFRNPNEAVITEKLAGILFGGANPIGRNFEYEKTLFTVTGLIKTLPANSLFNFDYFLSGGFRYQSYPDLAERWYVFGSYTFVTFHGKRVPDGFERKLAGIEGRYYPDFMKNRHTYQVAAFRGSHLNPALSKDLVPPVSAVYLWILSAIALGILVIACLNFMSITMANASKRTLETGIKKVCGATPGMIIGDFFAGISMVVIISLVISFIGMNAGLPYFNSLIGKRIIIDYSDPVFWFGALGFVLLTLVLSGLYPSVMASRPSPVMGLLQRPGGRQNRLTFQKGFVVVQFVISIALATSQWFIFRQLSFMREHGGGFDQENLVTLPVRSLGNTAADRMKNTAVLVETLDRYRSQYGYGKVAVTEYVPGFGFRNLFKIYPDGDTYPDGLEVLSCDVDENFIEVFGLRAVQGRFFSNEFPADRDALVLNEAACRALGSKSVEGQRVGLIDKANRKEVVGVVNDINIKSLQYSIEPMIYQFGRHHNYPGYVSLRLEPGRGAATVEFIRAKWEELFPDVPFAYEGVKEKFRASYGEEERLARIIGMFSLLAVMLSLLGIFALSALESGKRIREIGIRRVNGARVIEVMLLLNLDFLKWVAVAFVLSMPAAWLAVHRWLGNFAYRTELSWWVFAVSGFGVILVSLFTVSWQSWRAATQNPVQSLRNE